MYKARWNFIHELEATDGFARVERAAYFGWLALRAKDAPVYLRLQGLDQYAAVGSGDVEEAKGVLYSMSGKYEPAEKFLRDAYRRRPLLRLRNYLRWLEKAPIEN